MEDAKIVELFWQRSEQAIRELDSKYGTTLREMSQRILNDTSDAEECLSDAYLGVWNAIPPHRPKNLLFFVRRVVRNLSINRYRKNTAQKRNSHYDIALEELEDCLPSPVTVEAQIEAAELTRVIEGFLDSLNTENRVIFLRRYWYADSYADIGKRTGLREKVISVRLVRLRKQLAKYLSERGFDV